MSAAFAPEEKQINTITKKLNPKYLPRIFASFLMVEK
jgi:hypothetical protein